MSIERALPDMERLTVARPEMPPEWKSIQDAGSAALNLIVRSLHLNANSWLGRLIQDAKDLGIFVPKRKTANKNTKHFRLCCLLRDDILLWFNCPSMDRIQYPGHLPDQFNSIVRHLGLLHFTQHSGSLIWPSAISELSRTIGADSTLLPFYDYGTGDYDCWIDGNDEDVYCWNHEKRISKLVYSGNFSGWMDLRARQIMYPQV